MVYDVLSDPTVVACLADDLEEALTDLGIDTPYPDAFALGVLRGAVRQLRDRQGVAE